MDTVNSLTTESAVRKLVVTGIALFSFWWHGRHGSDINPTVMQLISDDILPIVIPSLALIADTVWSWIRHSQGKLREKVAQLSPEILTDAQLKATVATVKELQGVQPDAPLQDVVAAANGIREGA